jgi:hypothetical protein
MSVLPIATSLTPVKKIAFACTIAVALGNYTWVVAKSVDSGKRTALKRRAKQQRPVNRPEKARRASLFSPTVYCRAFAAGEELTLQRQ